MLLRAHRSSCCLHLDTTTTERVDATPAARDIEELEVADRLRQRQVDDEVIAERLEAEHRPQQQERSARRPGVRAARSRVLDGVLRDGPVVAAEGLRQAPVEELRRIEDARRDLRGLVLEAVAPEAQAMNELSNGQTVPR